LSYQLTYNADFPSSEAQRAPAPSNVYEGDRSEESGRVGMLGEFEKGDDPLLNKILEFCRKHRYIRISEHLRDEEFFK
jgi:hypothetical protein